MGKKNPRCRSSWEHKFCYFLDHQPQVKKWSFESIEIQYYYPIDKKVHRYYPDFYFEEEDNSGKTRKFLVEVKPKTQTIPPKAPKNKNRKARKTYIYEAQTYVRNRCKWESAKEYCKRKGYEFRIVSLVKRKGNEVWEVFSLNQI
jgi:hypothetical protein